MATQMTKSQLIEKIAATTELPKKGVKEVFETLATIGYKELKRTGVFLVPGFAKFVVIKKPATKERQGTNPFTKEPMTFKAKPARKIVRARPVKAAKDAVEAHIRRPRVPTLKRRRLRSRHQESLVRHLGLQLPC
jgi:DNA-binding protein HU-beta